MVIATIVVKLLDRTGENQISRVVKVSAIGKYPFITIENTHFDFDQLLVGKVASKEITVHNNSMVPTSFTIVQEHDDGKDPSYSLSHRSAYLAPNTSNTVTVKYTP